MAHIEKKIRPEIFERLMNGEMGLDLRLADFTCEHGDTIEYKEWDPETKEYTGRTTTRTVAGVVSSKDLNFWSDEDIAKHGLYAIHLEK